MLVHTLVDGGTPDGAVLWQGLLDHLDALGGGNDTADVDFLGLASLHQTLDGCCQTAACSQHGVYDDERLVLGTLGSDILGMDADLGMLAVDIHAEGRDEAVVDVVEHVQKALVERQSGTEDGCQHDVLLLGQGDVDGTQRCGDGLRLVGQLLRNSRRFC